MKLLIKFKSTKVTASLIALTSIFTFIPNTYAHCEVPCGIYTDDTVFTDLQTHTTTIEKAMNEINKLSAKPSENMNQLVRWVNNKEIHATKIQEIVNQYFLTQRIKLEEANTNKNAYMLKLTQLHQMTVLAMKCKQTTDLEQVHNLRKVLEAFRIAYKK